MNARPIIVDENGTILGGNMRYRACLELGMKELPAGWVQQHAGWTLEQKRRFILKDNNSYGEFDWQALADEWAADDLIAGGFDEKELRKLLEDDKKEVDVEPQIDRAAELAKEWGTAKGQVWTGGGHRIMCGDSTNAKDVHKLLNGATPLLMVTDPPYGVEYDASWRQGAGPGNAGVATGKVHNDHRADWREAWELFPGDAAYVWHASMYTATVSESLAATGFKPRALIVWAKSQMAIGKGNYHHQHEPCWYAVRTGKTAHFTEDRTQTTLIKNVDDVIREGELVFFARDKAKRIYAIRGDHSTLWQIPKPQKSETGHSTQKPVECMARPMRNHVVQEVYDPFLGSGTSVIAAEQTRKQCYAMELDPGYVAVALQRYLDATGVRMELEGKK
jgi:DNA modification methylase